MVYLIPQTPSGPLHPQSARHVNTGQPESSSSASALRALPPSTTLRRSVRQSARKPINYNYYGNGDTASPSTPRARSRSKPVSRRTRSGGTSQAGTPAHAGSTVKATKVHVGSITRTSTRQRGLGTRTRLEPGERAYRGRSVSVSISDGSGWNTTSDSCGSACGSGSDDEAGMDAASRQKGPRRSLFGGPLNKNDTRNGKDEVKQVLDRLWEGGDEEDLPTVPPDSPDTPRTAQSAVEAGMTDEYASGDFGWHAGMEEATPLARKRGRVGSSGRSGTGGKMERSGKSGKQQGDERGVGVDVASQSPGSGPSLGDVLEGHGIGGQGEPKGSMSTLNHKSYPRYSATSTCSAITPSPPSSPEIEHARRTQTHAVDVSSSGAGSAVSSSAPSSMALPAHARHAQSVAGVTASRRIRSAAAQIERNEVSGSTAEQRGEDSSDVLQRQRARLSMLIGAHVPPPIRLDNVALAGTGAGTSAIGKSRERALFSRADVQQAAADARLAANAKTVTRRYGSDLKERLQLLHTQTVVLHPSSPSAPAIGNTSCHLSTTAPAPTSPAHPRAPPPAQAPLTVRRSTRTPAQPRRMRDSIIRLQLAQKGQEAINKTLSRGLGSKKRSDLPRDDKGVWGLIYPCVVDDLMAYLACDPGDGNNEGVLPRDGRGSEIRKRRRGKRGIEGGRERPGCGRIVDVSERHRKAAEDSGLTIEKIIDAEGAESLVRLLEERADLHIETPLSLRLRAELQTQDRWRALRKSNTVYIGPTTIGGQLQQGVFASRSLKKGTYIADASGFLPHFGRVSRHHPSTYHLTATYRFTVGTGGNSGMSVTMGPGRAFNHSCEPNVAFVVKQEHRYAADVEVKGEEAGGDVLISPLEFVLLRDVEDEELTVDYGELYFGGDDICLCNPCIQKRADETPEQAKHRRESILEDEKRNRGQGRRISINAPRQTLDGTMPKNEGMLGGIEEGDGVEDEDEDEDVVEEQEEEGDALTEIDDQWEEADEHPPWESDVLESVHPYEGQYSSHASSLPQVDQHDPSPRYSSPYQPSHNTIAVSKSAPSASRESRLFEPTLREYLQLLADANTNIYSVNSTSDDIPRPEMYMTLHPAARRWRWDPLGEHTSDAGQLCPPGSPLSVYRGIMLSELSSLAASPLLGEARVWIVLPQTEEGEGASEWSCSVRGLVECLRNMYL